MTDLDLAPEPVKAKEPAKRWRNRWRSKFTFRVGCVGHVTPLGSEFTTPCCEKHPYWPAFPSREIAEAFGLNSNAEDVVEHGFGDEYLGAFPVEAE